MAVTKFPPKASSAFNPVNVVANNSSLTISWNSDGSNQSVTLERVVIDGSTTFNIQEILAGILGVGPDGTPITTVEGIVQPLIPCLLSKGYTIAGTSGYVAVNAAQKKGEPEDLRDLGVHGVLSERPLEDNTIKIPTYVGYPSGVCLMYKNTYGQAISFLAQPEAPVFVEGRWLKIVVTSNTPWTAEPAQGIMLTQYSGEGNATIYLGADSSAKEGTVVTFIDSKGGRHPLTLQTPILELSTDSLLFPGSLSTQYVYVRSNVNWEVEVPDQFKEWIDVSPDTSSGTRTVTVRRNIYKQSGEFTITFKGEWGLEVPLPVKITAMTRAEDGSFNLRHYRSTVGEADAISVRCNVPWRLEFTAENMDLIEDLEENSSDQLSGWLDQTVHPVPTKAPRYRITGARMQLVSKETGTVLDTAFYMFNQAGLADCKIMWEIEIGPESKSGPDWILAAGRSTEVTVLSTVDWTLFPEYTSLSVNHGIGSRRVTFDRGGNPWQNLQGRATAQYNETFGVHNYDVWEIVTKDTATVPYTVRLEGARGEQSRFYMVYDGTASIWMGTTKYEAANNTRPQMIPDRDNLLMSVFPEDDDFLITDINEASYFNRFTTEVLYWGSGFLYQIPYLLQNSKIRSLPEDYWNGLDKARAAHYFCASCNLLVSIPGTLFSNAKSLLLMEHMFDGCTDLTGTTPKTAEGYEFWERAGKPGYPSTTTGTGCFKGCTKLTNYSEIPSNWK